MLNELVAIFLDAYHANIPYEYESLHYFESVITVLVLGAVIIGSVALALVTCWGTFTIIKGAFSRD